MGTYDVKYKCGHNGTVKLFGKLEERYSKIAWMEKNSDCPECEKRETAEAAAKVAEESDMPELEGTEKQVAWANEIRADFIKKDFFQQIILLDYAEELNGKILELGYQNITMDERKVQFREDILKVIRRIKSAKWYIENRGKFKAIFDLFIKGE